MKIECLDARTISDDDALAIALLLVKVWPKKEKPLEVRLREVLAKGKSYSGPEEQAPRFFLIRHQGQVIANAAILSRTITTTAGPMTIAGLALVCSDPDFRGQGLGAVVTKTVFALVDEGMFDSSLFQTSVEVQPFYEKLGACVIHNRIVNSLGENPKTSPFEDRVIMRYPSSSAWPEGEIDLRGPGY